MKNICELCSMDATYKNTDSEINHYYCDHHKTEGSIRIVNIIQKTTFQKITPLLLIFALIFILSLVAGFFESDLSLMNLMMRLMAFFFLIFGAFKLTNLKNFVEAYATYDVLAIKSKIYGYAYPFIEISLGLLYLFNAGGLWRDTFTLILMLIGSYGVWKALQKDEEIPCACLGVVFDIPMTKVTIIENISMAVMALYMIIFYFTMGNISP